MKPLTIYMRGSKHRAGKSLSSSWRIRGGGIYTRRFVTKYPGETAGLVFVDSAHEEQALRLRELDPQGPGLDDVSARIGLYIKPGERLQWRRELPLIVLGRRLEVSRTAVRNWIKVHQASESQIV
jgi:hypothetical protein